jgi:Fe-S cluster assembly iron-binding protein IscA
MLTVTEEAQKALKDHFEKQNLNSAIRVFLSQGG